MKATVKRRLARLEQSVFDDGQAKKVLQILVHPVVGPLHLRNSTYKRSICADGSVVEIIHMDGSLDHLTETEFDEWIASRRRETS